MKILSVICEFDPFHNGHAYLLSQARQKLSKELDKQDAELAKFYESTDKKAAENNTKSPAENLPPELRAKFAEMLKRENN